jgi:protease-4
MNQFFKSFFASLLAFFVFMVLGLVLLFGIIGAFSKQEEVIIPKNSVLVIDLAESFPEQAKEDVYSEILNKKKGKTPSLSNLIALIHNAKNDPAIKGIYLKCQENPNGFAASDEIRTALLDFKQSKKFIIAFGETITQKGYWIANSADFVFTHPQGGLEWTGFSYESMYLKGLLDKLEIQPQVFYAGKFKSATEPFRYTQMSPENKLQTSQWLNGMYDQFITGTAVQRKLNADSLKLWSDQAMIQTPADAFSHHLIDGLYYDDQVKSLIAQKINVSKPQDISFMRINEYAAAVAIRGQGSNKIAVIYADGDINMGKSDKDGIASDEYRGLLEDVKNDKSISAVVLRINSPGGSALASDVIWREIELLKKVKPVVVSMGNYAASGGYYIACNADSIFANANTITGSIGVFSVVPNFGNFMKNKLGVTYDGVKTSTYADMPTTTRALNATEQKFMQAGVDSIYFAFKSRVAKGRKRSVEYIDSIAQGRVWTGADALKVGLVDRIGNLEDAIASAAKMAKIKDYTLKSFPERKSFLEDILGGYQDKVKEKAIKEEIGLEQWDALQKMKSIKQMMGQPQTRLPIFVVNHP